VAEAASERAALVRRARRINSELARLYPDARIELNFASPLELLVAAILSARSTDRLVNQVTGPGSSLSIWSAASANRTLIVMTIVAAIFVPLVLAYQGWSYWVFHQRLTRLAGSPGAAHDNPPGR
jgi:Cytochrome bd terminal oxidase subunit II